MNHGKQTFNQMAHALSKMQESMWDDKLVEPEFILNDDTEVVVCGETLRAIQVFNEVDDIIMHQAKEDIADMDIKQLEKAAKYLDALIRIKKYRD